MKCFCLMKILVEVTRIGFPLYGCVSLSCSDFLDMNVNFISSVIFGKHLFQKQETSVSFFKERLFYFYLDKPIVRYVLQATSDTANGGF